MAADFSTSILTPSGKAVTILEGNTVLLVADGDLDQMHSVEAEISKYPIEGGGERSDHKRAKPDKYRATLAYSTTPIGAPIQIDREAVVFQQLKALVKTSRTLTVVTDLERYTDMQLVAVSAPRRVEQGKKLQVEVVFEQFTVSVLQSIAVPADVLDVLVRSSAKSKDDTKDQTKKDDGSTKAARKKTLAKALSDRLF